MGLLFGELSARQLEVLAAVREGRIARATLMGDLEPHLLNGKDASWALLGLTLRRLVITPSFGQARLTRRGQEALHVYQLRTRQSLDRLQPSNPPPLVAAQPPNPADDGKRRS